MRLPGGKFVHILVALLGLLAASTVFCPQVSHAAESPGRPVRVAYIEGGFYIDYASILVALAQGLAELGFIEHGNVPTAERAKGTQAIWQWLCANAGGSSLEFMPDGYYSGGWNDATFAEQHATLVARLKQTKDIGLVLAFGTKAGQVMAVDDHHTPVVVLSATDAVTAGIVASAEDSGRDHMFAMVQRNRIYREVLLFHDVFQFKKLGIAYEDSEEGRASVALPQVQQAAKDRGFDLVTCVGTLFYDNPARVTANLLACHETLVSAGAEAVYMTVNNGMEGGSIDMVLQPLLEARLPTFSQNGVDEVRQGLLLSISQTSFSGQGMFAASVVGNIVKGESPCAQKQIYEEPLSLALNLRTAVRIGWNPPLAVLAAVDEIFQGIR